jgi:hypothetical protein
MGKAVWTDPSRAYEVKSGPTLKGIRPYVNKYARAWDDVTGEARPASSRSVPDDPSSPAQYLAQHLDDARNLTLIEARSERQRDRPLGDVLTHGELPEAVTEALTVEAEQVNRREIGCCTTTSDHASSPERRRAVRA